VSLAELGQDFGGLQRVPPATKALREIVRSKPGGGPLSGQVPRLQINLGFSDEIIGPDEIIIKDLNEELAVTGHNAVHLIHTAKNGVKVAGNVVLLVVDGLVLAERQDQEGIRLAIRVSRLQLESPDNVHTNQHLSAGLIREIAPRVGTRGKKEDMIGLFSWKEDEKR